MDALVSFARWEMMILLGGLMLAVLYKLFTGGIDMSGLLTVKGVPGDQSFSSGRAQMLMSTVVAGMYYLLQVINNPSATSLPDVPPALVAIVGGSHAIYLGGKARDLLFGKPGVKGSK
jgi:hypothetical protein